MVCVARPVFSLRFRDPVLRERVRAVAEREGISQNEFLERAAEHEIVASGALLADELEAAASRLRAMTATEAIGQVEASIRAFVAAEAAPDPIRPRLFSRPPARAGSRRPSVAVAAFERR